MLQLQHIKKSYRSGNLIQKALDDVGISFRENEFVVILGPSGSGKTTLLNCIGGLDHYDEGDLIINDISTKEYKDRDWDAYRNHTIGFVFQSYNLIPHQNILANVELALTISGIKKNERRQRALDALEAVGLKEHSHKLPNQLSGGQMQRVAIARALVNNPDIILADEPTGALDSSTSIQVMELLKKVANKKLVIMVTHNPELAYQYASRIIEFKDGKIVSDSNPYEVKVTSKSSKEKMTRSSMSFLTSLQLSFNNLKTKKARTLLTAFAGSIGIIGIALILAISTGVNEYIHSIEENTLSEYPLSISSSALNFANDESVDDNNYIAQKDIAVANMITNLFKTFNTNDLASLHTYLQDHPETKDLTRAIEVGYDIAPHIYSANTSTIHQVHPDKTFASLGLGSGDLNNSMMSAMMSTDVFFALPSNSSLFENQYDVKAGHWPNNYNECVLVLSSNGKIPDLLLYALDLRDWQELLDMVDDFNHNETISVPTITDGYYYKDILGHEFKVVSPSDYYEYDSQYDVYINKSEDDNYMKELINNGETLKIVGIVEPKKDAEYAMLPMGVGFRQDLKTHMINKAGNSQIVTKQLNNPNIDVFSNQEFGSNQSIDFDMNSLFSIDANALEKAISFNQSKVNLNHLNLDLSQIKIDLNKLNIDLNAIIGNPNIEFTNENLDILAKQIQEDFTAYCISNELLDSSLTGDYFRQYLQSEQGQKVIFNGVSELLEKSGLDKAYLDGVYSRLKEAIIKNQEVIMADIANGIGSQMKNGLSNIINELPQALVFNSDAFASAIHFHMNQDELRLLLASMMTNASTNYENNLKKLGYVDLNLPTSLDIYPKDFAAKQRIVEILDEYNNSMKETNPDKMISYADYVGALMSSVTNIIDVISYVLIAFVAISLVVSSIMIGVITYISVLERKKEIGILRAIGASKHNVGTVFNAETFIIGLLSGLIGIVVTTLLLIPINHIIANVVTNYTVAARLPISAMLILITLSTFLTVVSGLLPANKASKEDPVLALRSE